MGKILFIISGIVVLVAVGWYVLTRSYGNNPPQAGDTLTTPQETEQAAEAEDNTILSPDGGFAPGTLPKETIVYTDSGFAPRTLTVKKGTTVTFKNQSSKSMWVASSVHPTHQDLPGFDQLQGVGEGETYTYTFDKTGSWKFHNHLAPSDTGVVVVEE